MIRQVARPILNLVGRKRGIRSVALTLAYAVILTLSLFAAYQLRFDFDLPQALKPTFWVVLFSAVALKLLCLFPCHQFDGLLTYFSTPDLKRLLTACASGSCLLGLAWLTMGLDCAPPRGVILTDFVLSIVMLSGMRLSFRYLRATVCTDVARNRRKTRRVGIIGAGDAGATLARELLANPGLALQPVAFFDDYLDKHCSIHGIPLLGRPERLADLQSKLRLEEIVIAMPSAPAKRVRAIVKMTQATGIACRTVPSLDQLASGRVSVSTLRAVQIEDLLGRPLVKIEISAVREILTGRTVMVTGAGGSIGSELCRQIVSFGPAALLLVERAEPQLFVIEQELLAIPHHCTVLPLLGDITHRGRMREIYRRFRPDIVFHAAAHKHVPMMELQPEEAINNNILGTAMLAELAIEHEVERFVLISTDKAVNPTSVMGATKRFAETYLQSLHTRLHRTKFMAVRFGNVLGSSGSVVPTFTRQIAAGGPVTITHPDMTRFFMTIPEAVTLVLQSAAIGKGGDIFVLDMGKPMKIVDLAIQMIALSGLKPHEDIEIVFTGLRPGEKLFEELSHGREDLTPTVHPQITRLLSPPQHHTYISSFLAELANAINDGHMPVDELKNLLAQMIPEYTPSQTAPPLLSRSKIAAGPARAALSIVPSIGEELIEAAG